MHHTGIRTRDPQVSSPPTCPLDQSAAVREGVPPISGHYIPGWATPRRSRAFPLCSVVSRAGASGRAPLCSGEVGAPSGAGRRGAVVVPACDLYVASRAGFSRPGSSWSLPSFLASCGDFIAPRTSSWEVLRAENDSVSCTLGSDRRRPSSMSFSTGLMSF